MRSIEPLPKCAFHGCARGVGQPDQLLEMLVRFEL
jgi:hypothetical protein